MGDWSLAGKIIFFILLVIVILFFIWTPLTMLSIKLCKQNNALGVLLFFILYNIFGIIIGICLIYNSKQGHYNNDKKLKILEEES